MRPLTMLGLCALGFAMGWVMRYNIRQYEPVSDEKGHLRQLERTGRWALITASLVNVAYYLQLMGAAIFFPFGEGTADAATVETIIAVGSLVALGVIGFFFGLARLNRMASGPRPSTSRPSRRSLLGSSGTTSSWPCRATGRCPTTNPQ